MKLHYIKKNLSLLNLIHVDISTLIELDSILPDYDAFASCLKKFKLDNPSFSLDSLSKDELSYMLDHYKTFFRHPSSDSFYKLIKTSSVFQENPNLFYRYIKSLSSPELFLLTKHIDFYNFLNSLNDELFSFVLKKIDSNKQLNYLDYLIDSKSLIIFPVSYTDFNRQYFVLSCFKFLPEKIEPYIQNNKSLLSKIKRPYSDEEIIKSILDNPHRLKNDIQFLSSEGLDSLFNSLKRKIKTVQTYLKG